MRTHPSRPQTTSRTTLAVAILALASLACLALLLPVAPARAATITDRPFLFAFDAHDTTAGSFTSPGQIAVDYAGGNVYVLNGAGEGKGTGPEQEPAKRVIDKFDAAGKAQAFSWTGASSLTGAETPGGAFGVEGGFGRGSTFTTDLAVDNSGGAGGGEQGRLYVQEEGGPIHAFTPAGKYLWTLPKATVQPCGIAVDGEGHLWVVDQSQKKALEFANAGSPPVQIGSVALSAGNAPCHPAIDGSASKLYVADHWGYPNALGIEKYAGGTFEKNVTSEVTRYLALNQSTSLPSPSLAGHLFGIDGTNEVNFSPFSEFDSSDSEVGRYGHDLIGSGDGIAYNPTDDRVYVADSASHTVKAFGPRTTGTVPDVSVGAADGLTRTEAMVHGTVNPQGVPDSYHVELVKGQATRVAVEATGGIFELGYTTGVPVLEHLTGAEGAGTLTQGSVTVTNVQIFKRLGEAGVFAPGQGIVGLGSQGGGGGSFVERGIPSGTKIVAVGSNTLTLSAPATVTGGINLASGLPFDVSPEAMRQQLEDQLLGAGNVSVTGTPATATGTPGEYAIVFAGALAGRSRLNRIAGLGNGHLTGPVHELFVQTLSNGEGWASAQSLPAPPYPSIAPTDSLPHAVSLALTKLGQNSAYDVRLVGTNTEDALSSYASPPAVFKTLAPPVPAISGLAVSPTVPGETAHVSATIDPQADQTLWRVLLSNKANAGASQAECEALDLGAFTQVKEGTIPNEEPGGVSIAADLSGLEHRQTYCVRVTATNSGGFAKTANVVFRTLAVKPGEVETAFVAPRTDTSVRLNGRVNPQGEAPLTYRFQYSADGTNWTVLPDQVSTTEARSQILVSEQLGNLQPGTTYHYRLAVAENEAGAAESTGADETFTTRTSAEASGPSSCPENETVRLEQRSTYLPDCRGVELVNNPEKGEQEVVLGEPPLMSPDGEKIVWRVIGGAPGGYNSFNTFLATRTGAAPTGWSSHDIAPPTDQQPSKGNGYLIFAAATPDLSRFAGQESEPSLHEGSFTGVRVIRVDESQHEQVLASYTSSAPTGGSLRAYDLTDDASHVVVVSPVPPGGLEDVGAGEPGEVLSIMPDGSRSACGFEGEEGGVFNGAVGSSHWIATTDASRVYFEARPNKAGEPDKCAVEKPRGLYVRNRAANGGAGETTLIDPEPSQFIRATPDGRAAYFLTSSKLDPADTNSHADVYRWDEAQGKSTCLTCVVADANVGAASGKSSTTANVLVSDDFSHVYFTSPSKLAPGATATHENVYVLSNGEVRFVADISGTGGLAMAERSVFAFQGEAEVSADGGVLVFAARTNPNLTADRVASGCPVENVGLEPCVELYRYDDRDGSVECVSCAHEGVTSRDEAGFALSGDGSTVAFTTAQPLLQADVNGGADVYEWRQGRVGLITNGVSEFPTALAGRPRARAVSRDGNNIFFTVVDPGLTGFEQDGMSDLYDARVGGGFIPPSPFEPCEVLADTCQGLVQPAPALPMGGGGDFHGAGNLVPAPPTKPQPRALTRAQKLAAALRACRKKARGKKRAACERQARKRYGPLKAGKAGRGARRSK